MRITIERVGVGLPLWRRLVWFVGLWIAGVVSVAGAAGLLRWILSE